MDASSWMKLGQMGSSATSILPNWYDLDNSENSKELNKALYGDSTQDPIARLIMGHKKDMQNVLSQVSSDTTDYSNYKTNDNIENIWNPNAIQSNVNAKFGWSNVADNLQATATGASYGAQLGGGWGALIGAGVGMLSNIGTQIGYEDREDEINNAINRANQITTDSYYGTTKRNQTRMMRDYFQHQQAEGGSLDGLNGVTEFNVGSSHSQNPYGGIQQGIASDGLPNLVEEGEVKYNDYIYSARLKPSKTLLKDFNLPEKYNGLTFAEVADKLQKESESRPNDPVSLRTLNEMMSRLAGAQEEYKAKQAERKLARMVDNMSTEEKAMLMSSLAQPMTQEQEGIDLGQPMYAKGGKIHIAKNKRGTFTAAAKKHGKSVQAFASQVLAHPENYSPAMRKKANFARNFGGHKHAEGGYNDYPFGAMGAGAAYLAGNYDPMTQAWVNMLQKNADFANKNLPENLNTLRFDVNQPKSDIELMAVTNPSEVSKGEAPVTKSVKMKPDTDTDNKRFSLGKWVKNFDSSNLRYTPAVGAVLGALEARLQPKDFTVGNIDRQLASQIGPIGTQHVGNYETLHLLDPNLTYSNNLAILARSLSDNRGLPAATRNALNSFTISKMQEKQALDNFNWQQANNAERQRVATHDLGIDKFNAQLTQADNQLNNTRLMARLSLLEKAALADDASKTAWAQNVSSTTENAWNQLGNVGRDEWNRGQLIMLLNELGAEGLKEYIKNGGKIVNYELARFKS